MPSLSTLSAVQQHYADEDFCVQEFARIRWKDAVRCVRCQSNKVSFLYTRNTWKCLACQKQFSVKTGTILEDQKLPLSKYICIFWLLANKQATSSYEIHRLVGITYAAAWKILKLFKASGDGDVFIRFFGIKTQSLLTGRRSGGVPTNHSTTCPLCRDRKYASSEKCKRCYVRLAPARNANRKARYNEIKALRAKSFKYAVRTEFAPRLDDIKAVKADATSADPLELLLQKEAIQLVVQRVITEKKVPRAKAVKIVRDALLIEADR